MADASAASPGPALSLAALMSAVAAALATCSLLCALCRHASRPMMDCSGLSGGSHIRGAIDIHG